MVYPPLVRYPSEDEYRRHFEHVYCREPIVTFDGIKVRFRKDQFKHSFYESSRRNAIKDQFSVPRAERIDWIKAALEDPASERYVGWDNRKKRYDKKRRVAIVMGNYVVIIRLKNASSAFFVTAFVADTLTTPTPHSTIDQIRKGPKWA